MKTGKILKVNKHEAMGFPVNSKNKIDFIIDNIITYETYYETAENIFDRLQIYKSLSVINFHIPA